MWGGIELKLTKNSKKCPPPLPLPPAQMHKFLFFGCRTELPPIFARSLVALGETNCGLGLLLIPVFFTVAGERAAPTPGDPLISRPSEADGVTAGPTVILAPASSSLVRAA